MHIRWQFPVLLMAGLFAVSAVNGAELSLNRYYTDNMVLQREKPVLIKGFADAGTKVNVTFASQNKTATADKDGAWSITLDPMKASAKPQTLGVRIITAKHGGDGSSLDPRPVTLDNVLVGDVLVFGRQTSIDVSLGASEEGKKAAQDYKSNPMLRAMHIKARPAKVPQEDFDEKIITPWAVVDSKSALKMNAAAFYLARDLVGKLDVPLGIVDIDMGCFFGTSWLSEKALDESVERTGGGGDLGWFRKHMPEDQEKWEQDKSAGNTQPGLSPLDLPYYPSSCYNAVINPLRSITPKGILLQLGNDYPLVTYALLRAAGKITDRAALDYAWAQGYLVIKHANRMTPYTLPLVPDDLRRSLGDEDIPIGWIMPPSSDFYDYAIHNREMREEQRRIAAGEENVALIMPGNEHVVLSGQPSDEKLLAQRCLKWVVGTFYDKSAPSSGPVFESVESKPGGEATVLFKSGTADGLRADGDALKQFEVAGPEGSFIQCEARIDGSKVKLTSDDIYKILWVRYNWNDRPDQGLVNSAGLPAVPFDSRDDWRYNWWPPSPPVELPVEYHTTANKWPERDVAIINGANHLAGGDSQPNPNELGPTGVEAAPFGPNLYVHGAAPGSPADGKVFRGDLIYGVNGEDFGTENDDKYHQFSAAITHAESRAGGGKLMLNIRRRGKNIDVPLKLEVLGSYSATTPYYCPKSERIVERAEEWLERRARPKSGMASEVSGRHGTDLWFLMASGKPEYQGLVRRAIYASIQNPPSKPDPNRPAIPWNIGYRAILLAEYYESTGDTNVLPYLESQAGWAAVTQLRPQSEPGPQEPAYTEQQVGGYRTRYGPNRPMSTGGYGLMSAAGMPCVMGMVLAKESGCDVNEVKLQRGLKHFYYHRAEYGDVIYWYHPLWRDHPPAVNPEAEARGGLWTQNGKLGTAASLFNMAGYPTAVGVCSRICVYSYNNTRHGHGGMFYNNFWTPIGAHIAGEKGFKQFMKGQTWWRELYRRYDGSFNQAGRGGVGVGYAIHYVAPKKRLRILDAPRSVFGTNCPAYLKPALAAHRKRDYMLAESLIHKAMEETVIPDADMPVVDHFLDCVQVLWKSVDYDLDYVERMIKEGKYYYASLELPQLKGVLAPDDPRLKAIEATLESPEGQERIKTSLQKARSVKLPEPEEDEPDENVVSASEDQPVAEEAPPPEIKRNWTCLVTRPGKPGQGQATGWKMKVIETPDQAPDKWANPKFDDSDWYETTFPISWRVSHTALFRCKFTIDDKDAINALRLRANIFHQPQVDIYLNGELIAKINNASSDVSYVLTDYALEVARNGENTLAVLSQHAKRWGKVKNGRSSANHIYFMLDAGKNK